MAYDKKLHEKLFNIAKNPNLMDIRGLLLQYFLNVLKKTYASRDKSDSGGETKNENMSAQQLGEELRNTIIRKLKKKSILTFYRNYLGC